MNGRCLFVPSALWSATWNGLRVRGGGRREAACVWAGTRDGGVERACEVIFLDDLPGTVGRRLQHRTSRAAVAMLLQRARELGLVIVGDVHTHPSDWVDLSDVDRAHPIEYRVGLVALVLPEFAMGTPDIGLVGVHEYSGDGHWRTFEGEQVTQRLCVVGETGAT